MVEGNTLARNSALAALLSQLGQSQWYSPADIAVLQARQLGMLLEYVSEYSSFYRQRLAGLHLTTGKLTPEFLANIPILSRQELQTRLAEINCRVIPESHGAFTEARSSGSTGQMVVVRRTGACMHYWMGLTMREHLWNRRDFSGSLAVIRPAVAENDQARVGVARKDWGPPASLLFETGPSYALNIMTDVARQAEWLVHRNPHYLLTFPTNVEALVRHFETCSSRPGNLRQIRTIGETLTDGLRQRCGEVLGIDVVDTYSSQELGVIAIQCPDSGLYHVMEENLVVEVLDEHGERCQPGEIGRIVVTDLHNFATPLIRYDTRDYAEAGHSCSCGRGLATFARIVGRSRNMVMLPDGRRYWPLVGAYHFRDVAPVTQYQFIQHSLTEMEVRLVVECALDAGQEEKLAEIIHRSLGYPFQLRFNYFENELPRHKNGKFEEFMCLVAH